MFPYPNLLLLDYSMPRLNGMDVLRFLRRRSRRPHVILWSNSLDQVNIPLALHFGADMVCRKPCNKEELLQIMNGIESKMVHAGSFFYSPRKSQTVGAGT